MQPWQKVMLVPYLAANDPANCALHNASASTDVSCRLDTQAAQTVRRLRRYFEWARSETRIIGFNGWVCTHPCSSLSIR